MVRYCRRRKASAPSRMASEMRRISAVPVSAARTERASTAATTRARSADREGDPQSQKAPESCGLETSLRCSLPAVCLKQITPRVADQVHAREPPVFGGRKNAAGTLRRAITSPSARKVVKRKPNEAPASPCGTWSRDDEAKCVACARRLEKAACPPGGCW